ncbi:MAG TPA: hypothetical protein VF071_12140 [Candidatus Limnocylindria bacterium]
MNREHDFDRTIRSWLDDGADRAPERFVWAALADVERIAQRGAWWALLETAMMKLKPAAPILGVAAVVLLAIAAYQFLGGNVGGPNTPTPTPTIVTAEQLPAIMPTTDTLPAGWSVDSSTQVRGAVLGAPIRGPAREDIFNTPGYVAGIYAEHAFSGAETDGAGVTWTALFEDPAAASAALAVYLGDLQDEDGWDLGAGTNAGLGDEGRTFTGESRVIFGGNPPADEPGASQITIWRVGNLLLAAGGFFDYDEAELRSIAEGMDARAH